MGNVNIGVVFLFSEIPNNVYMLLSQIMFGYWSLSQYCKLIPDTEELMRRQLLHINMPN